MYLLISPLMGPRRPADPIRSRSLARRLLLPPLPPAPMGSEVALGTYRLILSMLAPASVDPASVDNAKFPSAIEMHRQQTEWRESIGMKP